MIFCVIVAHFFLSYSKTRLFEEIIIQKKFGAFLIYFSSRKLDIKQKCCNPLNLFDQVWEKPLNFPPGVRISRIVTLNDKVFISHDFLI